MTEPQGRFLVVRGGAIGDFILTLPVFSAIREMFPHAHVELLGYPNVTDLALKSGTADGVRSIDARPMASFFNRKGHTNEELGEYFASFNIVVSFLYDPDQFFQNNVKACADHIQFVQGIHKPDDGNGTHATETLLVALQQLAIFDTDPVPRLDFQTSAQAGESWIAVHPGSGSPRKNWPVNHWFELLRDLSVNHRILVIGGEADFEALRVLEAALSGVQYEFMVNRPLTDVGTRLQSCRAFIGHDSGITHLAAAVGLPGVCLWGETNADVWRPRSDRIELLHGGAGLAGIEVATVRERLDNILKP